MCYQCAKLHITNQEFLEKNKPDFDKCAEYISVKLPDIKINKYFREEDLRFLLQKAEENNEILVKLHYLQSGDDAYRPYNIEAPATYQYDSMDELRESEKDRLTSLTFLAQYHLRYIAKHFVYHLEQIAAKKRRRRLQYKENKRGRGLKTNEPEMNSSEPEKNASETVKTVMMSNVLEERASDCECMVQ